MRALCAAIACWKEFRLQSDETKQPQNILNNKMKDAAWFVLPYTIVFAFLKASNWKPVHIVGRRLRSAVCTCPHTQTHVFHHIFRISQNDKFSKLCTIRIDHTYYILHAYGRVRNVLDEPSTWHRTTTIKSSRRTRSNIPTDGKIERGVYPFIGCIDHNLRPTCACALVRNQVHGTYIPGLSQWIKIQ